MGIAVFMGLVLCGIIVLGFMTYGAFLGLAILGRSLRGLWTRLGIADSGTMALAMAEGPAPRQRQSPARVAQPCWEVKGCGKAARESCPAYLRPDLPCWLAKMQSDPGLKVSPDCMACKLFNIPALMTGM